MEGGKLRKCLRRKINWLRDEEGGNGASDGERGAKKRKQDGDRSVFCVCAGLFLWSSVSVFQLWTVDYSKIHKCVCLSAFFWGQLQTLMWRERPISDCLWQHSHQLGGHLQEPTAPRSRCESAPGRRRQAHCSNSQQARTWQRSCCYTLPAPCAALIHYSVLQHDNPTHMVQPHTR